MGTSYQSGAHAAASLTGGSKRPCFSFTGLDRLLADGKRWLTLRWPVTPLGLDTDEHPHQLRQRASAHLLHDPRAVHLDAALTEIEVVGDDLVRPPRDDLAEHIVLTRRERA